MNSTEWEGRYAANDTPWEKGEPSPGLVDFLRERTDLSSGKVCVPGCGTGHDVRAWVRAGFSAFGFDFAPSAIRLARERTFSEGLSAEFSCLDFLTDPPPRQFDWVFEHTLFCAIEPSRREDYVRSVLRWLKVGGRFLAVHYFIPDRDGPPFGTDREEVLGLFSPYFELFEEWTPRSYPNRTGLERMFLWEPRELCADESSKKC
ncbi:MAG: methyltransferase domain-containing protein [Verrucomicrobia bacterium]|nr:methyltransferase domain-containing protein [Verrucomicrobiota bacterium]